MNVIREEFGIIPIRFAEIAVEGYNIRHKHSHISLINIPNKSIDDFHKSGNIDPVVKFKEKTRCKIILNHPSSPCEVENLAPFIDGYEIRNGCRANYFAKYEELLIKYAHLVGFNGADYHTWEGKGDPRLFTELPDDWFGEIYE